MVVGWNNSGNEYFAGKRLAERNPGAFDVDNEITAVLGNDGDRAPGNEAQAFQKTPGFILAMDFVDLANIADVEHGEWHGACMNQIRKEVSFIKLISQ